MLAFGFEGHTTKFHFVSISLFRYHPIQKWHIKRTEENDMILLQHFLFLVRIGLSVFGGSGAWPQRLKVSLKALHSQSGAPVVLAAFNMQVTTNDN